MSVQAISPNQLGELVKGGRSIQVIDVRTPLEFREVHATGAKNVPLDKLNPAEIAMSRNGSADPLYVICKSGARGKQACEKLIAAGQSNVVNVNGGTMAWEQAGLPVVRGQKAMSLERQVRIAAGSIVFERVTVHLWGSIEFPLSNGFVPSPRKTLSIDCRHR